MCRWAACVSLPLDLWMTLRAGVPLAEGPQPGVPGGPARGPRGLPGGPRGSQGPPRGSQGLWDPILDPFLTPFGRPDPSWPEGPGSHRLDPGFWPSQGPYGQKGPKWLKKGSQRGYLGVPEGHFPGLDPSKWPFWPKKGHFWTPFWNPPFQGSPCSVC